MNALSKFPHIEPVTILPAEPLSHTDWLEQYKLGALLHGPFDRDDPQIPPRVVSDYEEPATAESTAAWLHDNTTECCGCNRLWLSDDDDVPAVDVEDGWLCEECAEDVEPADNHSTLWAYRGSVVG